MEKSTIELHDLQP